MKEVRERRRENMKFGKKIPNVELKGERDHRTQKDRKKYYNIHEMKKDKNKRQQCKACGPNPCVKSIKSVSITLPAKQT